MTKDTINPRIRIPALKHTADLDAVLELVRARAVDRELERTLFQDEIELLRGAGFGTMTLPRNLGGSGASVVELTLRLIALSEADSNLAQVFRAHFATVESLLTIAPRERSDRWLARVAAGEFFGGATQERSSASVGSLNTRLERSGDGYLLNGTKHYSTGSIYTDWIAVTAALSDNSFATAYVRADAPGVVLKDDWDGFGQRLSGSGTTIFSDVAVPADDVAEFHGAKPSHLNAFVQLILLACLAGIGRTIVREAGKYVNERTRAFSHGSAGAARLDPLVQSVVGRLAANSYAADAVTLKLAATVEEAHQAAAAGAPDADLINRAEREAGLAQIVVTELVLSSANALFDVGGASALSRTRSFDRLWRNARTIASHNPVIYKLRASGEEALSGAGLIFDWTTGESAASTSRI